MLSLDALSPGSLFPDLDDGDFLTIHLSRYSIQEGFSICHDGKRRLRCAFADLVVQDKNVPQPKNKRCTFFVAFKPAETVRRIVVSASNLKHNHRFELPPRLERVEKADIALRFAGDDDDPGILGCALDLLRDLKSEATSSRTRRRLRHTKNFTDSSGSSSPTLGRASTTVAQKKPARAGQKGKVALIEFVES